MVKATELRKNLFQTLDQAIQGTSVTILYKGVVLTLSTAQAGSKLERAVLRNALVGDPDSIVSSDQELLQSLEKEWQEEASLL